MSPLLAQLPTELLLLILENVALAPRSTPALASLCLTSMRLRSLAEPFLYSSPSIGNSLNNAHLFLLTILGRPALADHVRNLDIQIARARGHDMNPLPEETIRRLWGFRLWTAIEALNLPPDLEEDFERDFDLHGTQIHHACLELSLLLASRNLETLSVQQSNKSKRGTDAGASFRLISSMIFKEPTWLERFDKVHSFSTTFSGKWVTGDDIFQLAYVFKMPSLRRFEAVGCRESPSEQFSIRAGMFQFVEGSSAESIILRHSDIGQRSINALLKCCKAVKHLYIEIASPRYRVQRRMFQFSQLEDALCRHAESLQHLAILQDESTKKEHPWSEHSGGQILFLPRLYNLCSVVLPSVAFPPHPFQISDLENRADEAQMRKYLPPSLEKISICNDNVHYGNTKHPLGFA